MYIYIYIACFDHSVFLVSLLIVRIWQGTPILVIVSILAYFCFLEELLVINNYISPQLAQNIYDLLVASFASSLCTIT
jgi:ABC-type amino acid transport system permease subunit